MTVMSVALENVPCLPACTVLSPVLQPQARMLTLPSTEKWPDTLFLKTYEF